MPSCLDSLPNNLELSYGCATEIVSTGPIAALLILIIGVPLIKITKAYLRRFFDRTEIDEGIENFIFRIAGVAMWAIVWDDWALANGSAPPPPPGLLPLGLLQQPAGRRASTGVSMPKGAVTSGRKMPEP
ncbi:MAG: hypothetical protein QF519_03930, partial [Candidatus Poseidoniia archaeon]|nr:hypothetical protein [Candidatus Poseidoniia archaeon]